MGPCCCMNKNSKVNVAAKPEAGIDLNNVPEDYFQAEIAVDER